jgi:hypothetical protein
MSHTSVGMILNGEVAMMGGEQVILLPLHIYKGQSKVMCLVFCFLLFTSLACENFTELHCSIAKGILSFSV